jgi:hypothetical protein
LWKTIPTLKDNFVPFLNTFRKSSYTCCNLPHKISILEFIIIKMHDFKPIAINQDFSIQTNQMNHNYIINTNTFSLTKTSTNQFTSILYLLREDIILIFRRRKDASFEDLSETDFSQSILEVNFSFWKTLG